MRVKDPSLDGMVFVDYLAWLRQQGLILEKPFEVRRNPKEKDCFDLICTFVDQVTARSWKTWPSVEAMYRTLIKPLLKSAPRLSRYRDVIMDFDKDASCSCEQWNTLLIMPSPYGHTSGLICCDCRYPIPTYKIPEGVDYESWRRLHNNVADIWFQSGTLEMWAQEQLRDFNSDLNRATRKVMSSLRKTLNTQVYYWIWTEADSEGKPCPNCKAKGHPTSWDYPIKICKRCRLAFDS